MHLVASDCAHRLSSLCFVLLPPAILASHPSLFLSLLHSTSLGSPACPMALPPRWPQFCATAWEGIIASQYGLFHDPVEEYLDKNRNRWYWDGGYKYTVSSVEWLKCAQAGCPWCRFLAKTFLGKLKDSPQWPSDTTHIRVGPGPSFYNWLGAGGDSTMIVINGLDEICKLHTTEGSCLAMHLITAEHD